MLWLPAGHILLPCALPMPSMNIIQSERCLKNKMTNTQLFFAILGSVTALFVVQTTVFTTLGKAYLDAKIDPLRKQVDLLVQYMVSHEGKIAKLEERTKNL
jgi:hypothetical protein